MTTGTDTNRSAPTRGWVRGTRTNGSRLRGGGRRRAPHLMLGLLLVVMCAAVFVVVSLNAGDRRPVLVLARAVSVGQVLSAQDVRQVSVAVDPGVSVVAAAQASSVVGRTLAISLPAGALLVPEAVGSAAMPPGVAIAAVALKAGQFPPDVWPGAHVLVVAVTRPDERAASGTPAAEEAGWPAVVTGVVSPPNEPVTVVSVQLDRSAARQVAALPAGGLSLVLVSAEGR